jgi:hypothetical protein
LKAIILILPIAAHFRRCVQYAGHRHSAGRWHQNLLTAAGSKGALTQSVQGKTPALADPILADAVGSAS